MPCEKSSRVEIYQYVSSLLVVLVYLDCNVLVFQTSHNMIVTCHVFTRFLTPRYRLRNANLFPITRLSANSQCPEYLIIDNPYLDLSCGNPYALEKCLTVSSHAGAETSPTGSDRLTSVSSSGYSMFSQPSVVSSVAFQARSH
jgi:hypothetical protein